MATTPEAQARVCQEACATTFPTQAAGGLLWVWPSSGRDAWAESAATEPPADESLADAEWTFQLQPLSYESLVENVLDPTHAPFLHEGLAGQGLEVQSPANAVPLLEYDLVGEITPSGFTVAHTGYSRRFPATVTTRRFDAPSSVEASVELPAGLPPFKARLYFVPAAARETRLIFHFPNYEPTPPRWVRRLPAKLVTAVHDSMHARHCVGDVGYWRFNDQDRIAMAGQDSVPQQRTAHSPPHAAEERGAKRQAVRLALSPSDFGVATFHRWLSLAHGGPFAAAGGWSAPAEGPVGPTDAPRWRLHCGHCPRCRRSLARAVAVGRSASRAAVATLIGATGLIGVFGRVREGAALACLALLLRWASSRARSTEDLFFRGGTDATRTEDVYYSPRQA